jgi:hypothetical protein
LFQAENEEESDTTYGGEERQRKVKCAEKDAAVWINNVHKNEEYLCATPVHIIAIAQFLQYSRLST